MNELIGLPEFARIAGRPYITMWRLRNQGDLPEPTAVVGGRFHWDRPTIDQWVNNGGDGS